MINMEYRESNLFPFEFHWDACDVETRKLIHIPSGEWCHGILMPNEIYDLPPINNLSGMYEPLTELDKIRYNHFFNSIHLL